MRTKASPRRAGQGMVVLALALVAAACELDFSELSGSLDFPNIPASPAEDVCGIRSGPPVILVSDEASLIEAVQSGPAGARVAVQGQIPLTSDLIVTRGGVTLTCADAYAGFTVASGAQVEFLVQVWAPDVTVSRLSFIALEANSGALLVDNDHQNSFADRPRILDNDFFCGPGLCVQVQGYPEQPRLEGAVIRGNRIDGTWAETGLHIARATGAVVALNEFRVSEPGASHAVQIVEADGVELASNRLSGPSTHGVGIYQQSSNVRLHENVMEGVLQNPLQSGGTDELRITRNQVRCGSASCLYLVSSTGLEVSDNTFTADGPNTGVHIQWPEGEVGVSRNLLVTTAPSLSPAFGAIRITGPGGEPVRGVGLEANVIKGPWQNGLAVNVRDGRIVANLIHDPLRAAILLNGDGNSVAGNELMAPATGLHLTQGCGNRAEGFRGAVGGHFAVLDPPTGANTVQVPQDATWLDQGDRDCTGDGAVDANVVR